MRGARDCPEAMTLAKQSTPHTLSLADDQMRPRSMGSRSMRGIVMKFVLVAALLGLPSAVRSETVVQARRTAQSEWESFSTRTLVDLKHYKPTTIPTTRFGGRADRKEKAIGFFYVKRIGERWWLVDPEGGLFIHAGVAAVKPATEYSSADAFQRLFGDKARWADVTQCALRNLGFNGIGGFSDINTLRVAPQPLAYSVTLSLLSSFGKKLQLTYQQPGHTGYIGECPPVFHPDFPSYCEATCQERMAALRDDPWLVGYYSDNELPVPYDMLDRMLALDAGNPDLASIKRIRLTEHVD